MTDSCNYDGYDYKTSFWGSGDRDYENGVEKRTLTALFRSLNKQFSCFMDAGCGFGRLFSAYSQFGEEFVLLDYSQSMLDEAVASLDSFPIRFVQGSLERIPLENDSIDGIMSIRTLHHLDHEDRFLSECYRLLRPGGILVFEVPNKSHLLNRIKYALGKLAFSPYSDEKVKLAPHFYNYHPNQLKSLALKTGFRFEKQISLSFFRLTLLKKIVPVSILIYLDLLMQKWFSWTSLTPSIYLVYRKD